MVSSSLCIVCENRVDLPKASKLSERLALPLFAVDEPLPPTIEFLLLVTKNGLALCMNSLHGGSSVTADFANPRLSYRVRDAVGQQAIARAVGIKSGAMPAVLDATAGLGKDAFLLASLGCTVLMTERNKIVHALLEDALQRAQQSAERGVAEAASRLTLQHTDFRELNGKAGTFDVVYLDPMFPRHRKTARAKQDMFVLQIFFSSQHSGESEDGLLAVAMAAAGKRVVVKRARLAGYLNDTPPSYTLTGSSSRYDVYLQSKRLSKSV